MSNPSEQACQSRPQNEVFAELMDSRRAKSEHEHLAARIITRLLESLKECSDDLEIYVEQAYAPLRGYPAYESKRFRDLRPVHEARELIQWYK